MIEGESAVHAAGAKAARGIVVQVTDETGRPVDGAAVSFRLPEEGPGATFAQNLRTDIAITTPDGRASMPPFQCGATPGPFQVRVTAVKGQVRAGTVVGQYISEQAVSAKDGRSSKRKWLTIGALVAAGAAGGILASGAGGSSSTRPATPAVAPPQIGTPSIVIGRN